MATSRKEHEVNNPTEIELIAIFLGLQLCMHTRIINLIIESDFFFYGASSPANLVTIPCLCWAIF